MRMRSLSVRVADLQTQSMCAASSGFLRYRAELVLRTRPIGALVCIAL